MRSTIRQRPGPGCIERFRICERRATVSTGIPAHDFGTLHLRKRRVPNEFLPGSKHDQYRIGVRNVPWAFRIRPKLLQSEHVALKLRSCTSWRSYFSFGGACAEGSAVPLPSTKDTNRSPGPPGNCSSKPLGQRTSIWSKEAAEPSPKWGRGSLVER